MQLIEVRGKPCLRLPLEEALPFFAAAWQKHPNDALPEVYAEAVEAAFRAATPPAPPKEAAAVPSPPPAQGGAPSASGSARPAKGAGDGLF